MLFVVAVCGCALAEKAWALWWQACVLSSPGEVTLPWIVDPIEGCCMGRLSGLPLPLPKKSAGSSARRRAAPVGTKRTGPHINTTHPRHSQINTTFTPLTPGGLGGSPLLPECPGSPYTNKARNQFRALAGSRGWTRTNNRSINSRMLCQLSYAGICSGVPETALLRLGLNQ